MKRKSIRVLSLALTAVILMASLLTGCSGVNGKKAVAYEGGKVSCALFEYLCCLKKTEYLYEAYGLDPSSMSTTQLQDNAAIWSAKAADGSTVGDTLKSEVLDDVKLLLYMQAYAKEEGYDLDKEKKAIVEQEFNKMVANFGDKAAFNEEMKKYGIDYDQMLEYNYLQAQAYQGTELLFGENGTKKITDQALEKYFENQYATVSYIFINTKNKTYSNGKVVALPKEEKEDKLKLADDLFARVQQGEDFAALAADHSDKKPEEGEQNGVTFPKGSFVNSKAEEKVFSMKVGEFARVDADEGVYILYRRNLDKTYFDSAKAAIRAELEDVKKFSLVSEVEEKFELNVDFLNGIDVSALAHVV